MPWGIKPMHSKKKTRPAPSPRDVTSLVPAAAAAAADAEVLGKLSKAVTRNSASMNSLYYR
jgi:hypothetical protein